jgi:hypothetical protein
MTVISSFHQCVMLKVNPAATFPPANTPSLGKMSHLVEVLHQCMAAPLNSRLLTHVGEKTYYLGRSLSLFRTTNCTTTVRFRTCDLRRRCETTIRCDTQLVSA